MKLLSVFLILVIFSTISYSIDISKMRTMTRSQMRNSLIISERTAYESWLNFFFEKVNYFSPNFTSEEIKELNSILEKKPSFGAKYYDIWIKNIKYWIDDFSPNFTVEEKNILELIFRSKPDGAISCENYSKFIDLVKYWVDDFSPNFTAEEKIILKMLNKANVKCYEEGSYDIWLKFYKKWYNDFEPNITVQEKEILDIINMYKPIINDTNNDNENNAYIKVRKARIQGIINLINEGRYNKALSILYGMIE